MSALTQSSTDSTVVSRHGVESFEIAVVEDEEDEVYYPDGGLEAYLVVFGSFLGCIVNLGIINSIGAIQVYVSNHQLAHVKATTISWIFSVYLALSYLIAIFTGPVFDSHGPLGLLICSSALIFLGFMGSANSVEVWQFILSFVSLGIGNGLGMTPVIGVISHWFLEKRGNCTGIATSGGSVGGLIFPLMLRHLYGAYGFQWAIRILAFTCLGFLVAATILVKARLVNSDTSQTNWKRFSLGFRLLSFSKLREPRFLYVVLGGFFSELALVLLLTYFATYAIAQGVSESNSYLLLTLWSGTGIIGRWLPAYLSDFYGKFNVNIVMLLLFTLVIFVMWYPFGSNEKVLFAFAAVGGCVSGSISSLLPACLALITPVNEFGAKYGVLNAACSLANLFGVPIASAIIGKGTVRNYDNFVVFVGVMMVLGTTFWYLSRYTIVGFKFNAKI